MNIQDFIEKIQEGSLPDAAKSEIVAILKEHGATFESKELIKDIIQASIDADMADILTDEDRIAISNEDAAADEQISQIQADAQKDMDFVETELSDLQNMVSDLDKVVDAVEIENIKNNI